MNQQNNFTIINSLDLRLGFLSRNKFCINMNIELKIPVAFIIIPDMALNDWKYDFLNCSLPGIKISCLYVSGKTQTDIRPAM